MQELIGKIKNRTARIAIVGLGYTGLPLAVAFARRFTVLGYDINGGTVNILIQGKSHIKDVKDREVARYLGKTLHFTQSPQDLAGCDFFILCLPTPLTPEKEPDLSYIVNACRTLSNLVRKGNFVILESTTYPGTTEELLVPLLEEGGLKAVRDFGVAYSPERIDPGNKKFHVANTPKVVGGINPQCTEIAARLYGSIIETVVKVRDCRTAEATKMVENIFRNVNIALVNELALIFEKMGLDTWEIIQAAASKPYGYMPFYPGPGVGGHCIPLDPYYMSYKAKKFSFIPRFIELSGEINEFMKIHALNLAQKGLGEVGRKIYGSQIAILGLAYKKDVPDTRESPAKKIIEEVVNLGGVVRVYDPFAPSIQTGCGEFHSLESLGKALSGADCALIVTDHTQFRKFNWEKGAKLMRSPILVDCRNVLQKQVDKSIIYYGIGKSGNSSHSERRIRRGKARGNAP